MDAIDKVLKEAREACEAATTGKWFDEDYVVYTNQPSTPEDLLTGDIICETNEIADAQFITLARDLMPKLLAVTGAAADHVAVLKQRQQQYEITEINLEATLAALAGEDDDAH